MPSDYPGDFDLLDEESPLGSDSRTDPSLAGQVTLLNQAVDKMQLVLGLDPQSSFDDVAARLDDIVADISAVTLSPPASDLGWSGARAGLVAAQSLVAGDVVYCNSSTKYAKADADAIATASAQFICLETIAADATGNFGPPCGFFRKNAWDWTPGGLIYLSTVAGEITQTPPSGEDDVVQILGYAHSADIIWWNPQLWQAEHLGS